jgi:urease accessory protein
MSVAALLLSDSRFPAGGHAHSGGVEPAVSAGTVADLGSLEAFLRGRLRTAGLVAAAVAAAACARAAAQRHPGERDVTVLRAQAVDEGRAGERDGATLAHSDAALGADADECRDGDGSADRATGDQRLVTDDGFDFWAELDAEADARTPSPAQRAASRRQGRALLRAARVAWPDDRGLADLAAFTSVTARTRRAGTSPSARATGAGAHAGAAVSGGGNAAQEDGEYRGGPHHAIALGVAAAAAGCCAADAARIAAYQSAAGATSAAVRLLAFDPMRATAILSGLAGEIDLIAERAAAAADGPLADLPCPSAPALDLLAEAHVRTEVRLFES